jgi:predicted ester cyclase
MKGLIAVFSLLAVVFLALLLYRSSAGPPAEMTGDLEVNKQVVLDLYAAIDAQDYDQIRALISEDASGGLIGTTEMMPRGAAIEMMQMFYAAFPDYTHQVDGLVAEGDWVAARVTYNATHQSDFMEIPATGNPVTYGGVNFLRVVDGQVHEFWMLENELSLMQQLGMQLVPIEEG